MTSTLVPATKLGQRAAARIPNESAEYRRAHTALFAEEIELRWHIERVAGAQADADRSGDQFWLQRLADRRGNRNHQEPRRGRARGGGLQAQLLRRADDDADPGRHRRALRESRPSRETVVRHVELRVGRRGHRCRFDRGRTAIRGQEPRAHCARRQDVCARRSGEARTRGRAADLRSRAAKRGTGEVRHEFAPPSQPRSRNADSCHHATA